MRILIATDAWYPQINGVVRTLSTVADELWASAIAVEVLGPERFPTVPMPSYPEVRIAVAPGPEARPYDGRVPPDAVHIPVEGPIGLAARRHCLRRALAVHDLLPHPRRPLFPGEVRRAGRSGRGPAALVPQCRQRLHGPDRQPRERAARQGLRQHPPLVPRGRHRAVPARCQPMGCSTCRARCSPMSAGSRPRRTSTTSSSSTCPAPSSWSAMARSCRAYRERYPGVVFAGWKKGEELSRYYSASDVFVFPSRFETFGLVLLEALACGVPVAAFPVPGPIDVIGKAPVGRARPGPASGGFARPVDSAHAVPRVRAAILLAPQRRGVRRQSDADPARAAARVRLSPAGLEWRHAGGYLVPHRPRRGRADRMAARAASRAGTVRAGGGDGAQGRGLPRRHDVPTAS